MTLRSLLLLILYNLSSSTYVRRVDSFSKSRRAAVSKARARAFRHRLFNRSLVNFPRRTAWQRFLGHINVGGLGNFEARECALARWAGGDGALMQEELERTARELV